ncbi:MAG: putative Fe-S cluster assembly protein SufT [Verrucomicrobiia bacterium]
MESSSEPLQLRRAVPAVQIPQGTSVTLEAGAAVIITQSLGGSFTLALPDRGGLFRVAGSDADALGLTPPGPTSTSTSGSFSEEAVWAALKTCYDPEIPVNIVDLGLIYSMEPLQQADGSWHIDVKMTLTAPGCGMGPAIAADARQKILALPGVSSAEVHVVWDPPWAPSMISPEGKLKLGIE